MKLPVREAELFRRCDEVLHYMWDPIGVAGIPEARGEYSAYVPRIFTLIRDEVPEADVLVQLRTIQAVQMSMGADPGRDQDVVEALRRWRTWIWNSIEEQR